MKILFAGATAMIVLSQTPKVEAVSIRDLAQTNAEADADFAALAAAAAGAAGGAAGGDMGGGDDGGGGGGGGGGGSKGTNGIAPINVIDNHRGSVFGGDNGGGGGGGGCGGCGGGYGGMMPAMGGGIPGTFMSNYAYNGNGPFSGFGNLGMDSEYLKPVLV